MTTTVLDRVFNAAEVADLLQCTAKTVERHARAGELPGLKFGDGWVFPAGALFERLNELALEEAHKRAEPPPPSHVLHSMGSSESGRRKRRTPPILPKLPT